MRHHEKGAGMKKIILILICVCLGSGVGLWAFEKGSLALGGSVGYKIDRFDTGSRAVKNSVLTLSPTGGYFVMDNLCLDLNLRYTARWFDTDQSAEPAYGIGIGARYFVKRFYGGLSVDVASTRVTNVTGLPGAFEKYQSWETRKEAKLKAGYMLPLLKNVYADLGVFYRFGLGKYTDSKDSSYNYDNNLKEFGTTIGIAFFVK